MEHTQQHEHSSGSGDIKKVTIILSVLTLIELALGFWMIGIESNALRLAIKGLIVILMLAKAFYIVAYFMHLKHELKNMIMTIIFPLTIFIWFIIAFLADGDSYKEYQQTFDQYKKEKSVQKVENKHTQQHEQPKHSTQH